MLGKSISGILGVVERVWGGDGPPRVGLDGFQSIQNAKTCFSIFDFQSCILAFLTFQSFHPKSLGAAGANPPRRLVLVPCHS